MLKLYVDDLREAPEGWHLARTITEAIRILATMEVSEVSLDHDIIFKRNKYNSESSETFEPVCRFIKLINEKYKKPIKVYCHSGNNVAYDKYSGIIGYKITPFACRGI